MISVVVVCLNEESKLSKCLKSIESFADELVVVDLGSIDDSIKIAKGFGAKVYYHKFVPYVESIRNFVISKTTGDWVLILDPDEVLTSNLKEELKQIEKENKYDAVNIPRKNIFFGRWIYHSNWWPDRHVRFFKKGKVKWSDKIHSYPEVNGDTIDLEAKEELVIIHNGYKSINEFLSRQNRYSSIEAENLYKEGVRFSWMLFFWKSTREFLVRFLKHRGFLDGFYGFVLTYLMMIYQFEVMIKLWEKEKK